MDWPRGIILCWSGAYASIPAGWALCDGTGGTPDLRGRFIAGAPPGWTRLKGGSNSVTLLEGHLPGHTHSVPAATALVSGNQSASHTHSDTTGDQSVSHTHSATSGSTSADHTHGGTSGTVSSDHSHWYQTAGWYTASNYITGGSGTSTFRNGGNTGGISANHTHWTTFGGVSAGHTHSLTTGNQSASHTHSVTTGNQSVSHTHDFTVPARSLTGGGSGTPLDVRPAYYALALIMKL